MLQIFKLHFFFPAIGLLLVSLVPQSISAQKTADSLRALICKSTGLRQAELNMELANYFVGSQPDSAIQYGLKARYIGKRIGNTASIIRSYAVIGEAYQKKNDPARSISTYLEGLVLAEKAGEKSLEGTLCNGIGVSYFYLNDLEKSERYLKRAAEAKADAGDFQYYSIISSNLAALQIARQSHQKAIGTLKTTAQELLKKKQYAYLATIYNSLGGAYQVAGSDSCVFYFEKSLALSKKFKDPLTSMTSLQNLGDYYLSVKDYPMAVAYMKKAIDANKNRPEDKFLPDMFDRLSAAYGSAGDFRNAYYYKKLETGARQRLFTADKQKAIEELEIRYQSEKKEKELQLGRQQVEKAKNTQLIVVFTALLILLMAGFTVFLLFQKRKNVRRTEQEKLRLFENIVHEIRTPLTLIDGPVRLLKNGEATEEHIDLLERNSGKLMRLVDELLDASKLGRKGFTLHFVTGTVGDVVKTVSEEFRSEAKSRNIRLTTVENSPGTICTFPYNALEKILSNLIGNALKYSPDGAEVDVISDVNDGKITIAVKDNGPEIPERDRKRIFERFFRGNPAAGIKGTGIGLSLVQELASLAGGSVRLESGSQGNSFVLEIPAELPDERAVTGEQTRQLPTVLLVEDDNDTAAFTISVLKNDFHIVRVENGRLALEKISEELPDIVLSDVMMPLMNGTDLLRAIRKDELTGHIPVVLFSAKSSAESRLQGLQLGADAYIAKPFSPEELKLTLSNMLTAARRNRELYRESVNSGQPFTERIRSPHAYVNKVIEHILARLDDPDYSVNALAEEMSVSRSQLHRKMVALTGFSTTAFISMIRLEKAKDLLSSGGKSVTETAFACGFSSQSYFSRSFTEYFGKSPSQLLKDL